MIFREAGDTFAVGDRSIYGLYNGRSCQEDEDKIYVNKDVSSIFLEDLTDRLMS